MKKNLTWIVPLVVGIIAVSLLVLGLPRGWFN